MSIGAPHLAQTLLSGKPLALMWQSGLGLGLGLGSGLGLGLGVHVAAGGALDVVPRGLARLSLGTKEEVEICIL